MEIKCIAEILARRKWTVIFIFALLFSSTVIGTFSLPAVYKATATIMVKQADSESYILSSIGLAGGSGKGQSEDDDEVDNHIALATSIPVLDTLIQTLGLKSRKGDLQTAEELLTSKFPMDTIFPEPFVELEAVEGTKMIEIASTSPDLEEAVRIANTLASIYIEKNTESVKADFSASEQKIQRQIESVKEKNLKILEGLLAYKAAQNIVNMDLEIQEAVDHLSRLKEKKESNANNLSDTTAKIRLLKQQLGAQNETQISSSTVKENSYIERLQENIIDLELRRIESLTEKKELHPDVVIFDEQLAKLKAELKSRVKITDTFSAELQSLEREVAGYQAEESSLDTQIKDSLDSLYNIPGKKFGDAQFELDYKINQDAYNKLMEYQSAIRVVGDMIGPKIRLVEKADASDITTPDSPNKALNLIASLLLSVFFSFGAAFLLEMTDDSIRTPQDVTGQNVSGQGLSLLGMIPVFSTRQGALISGQTLGNPVNEAYRAARNNIAGCGKTSGPDTALKSILVTGEAPGQGATTTAANLAICLARGGKKVLLVDLNLRRPALHTLFHVSNREGATSLVSGEKEMTDLVLKTDIENLSLLTSGPVPEDPALLVDSENMRQMIHTLAERFDRVIVDTPSVFESNDALVLAGHVDGCVTVMDGRKGTMTALKRLVEKLNRARANHLGVILNKRKISTKEGLYYS